MCVGAYDTRIEALSWATMCLSSTQCFVDLRQPTNAGAYNAIGEGLRMYGVEGVCEVMFDVNEDGATEEIMTNCTLPQFAKATRAMIGPLEFTPGDGADTPATDDIIIPVQYCLAPEEE